MDILLNNDNLKLIFGIGNPGLEYCNTRHNLGFRVIDKISDRFSSNIWQHTYFGMLKDLKINNYNILLVKPLTYVNCCGKCLGPISKKYNMSLEKILVIVDDISLPLGCLRIKAQGSSGNHNGLKSIIDTLNTENFSRLKLGIYFHTFLNFQNLADYVLASFSKEEENIVEKMVEIATEAVYVWINKGVSASMNCFNQKK